MVTYDLNFTMPKKKYTAKKTKLSVLKAIKQEKEEQNQVSASVIIPAAVGAISMDEGAKRTYMARKVSMQDKIKAVESLRLYGYDYDKTSKILCAPVSKLKLWAKQISGEMLTGVVQNAKDVRAVLKYEVAINDALHNTIMETDIKEVNRIIKLKSAVAKDMLMNKMLNMIPDEKDLSKVSQTYKVITDVERQAQDEGQQDMFAGARKFTEMVNKALANAKTINVQINNNK